MTANSTPNLTYLTARASIRTKCKQDFATQLEVRFAHVHLEPQPYDFHFNHCHHHRRIAFLESQDYMALLQRSGCAFGSVSIDRQRCNNLDNNANINPNNVQQTYAGWFAFASVALAIYPTVRNLAELLQRRVCKLIHQIHQTFTISPSSSLSRCLMQISVYHSTFYNVPRTQSHYIAHLPLQRSIRKPNGT